MEDRLRGDCLKQVIETLLVERGFHKYVAKNVGEALVETSLFGIDSHGIRLLPKLLQRAKGKLININSPNISLLHASSSISIYDAQLLPGQSVMADLAHHGVEKASVDGIAHLIVKNSTHFGALFPYLNYVASQGFVCLAGSNSLRSMAAYGSTWPNLGNNPFGFSFPVKDSNPFIFDSSCAVMSFGKRAILAKSGFGDSKECFVRNSQIDDQTVRESLSVADSLEEIAIPFGGYKGASVAILIELLGGLLAGGPYGKNVETDRLGVFSGQTQFMLVLNPRVYSQMEISVSAKEFLDDLSASGHLRLPSARAFATYADRCKNGIPIPSDLDFS